MWIWLISFFSVINITEKMALCGIFLSAQCYKHSFRHFLWVCQVVFTVFVLMPPEQVESLVVLFNSFCVHMSNNLDMFWVWLCFCTERGHSDLTGGPVFFSFFFFLKKSWLLFVFAKSPLKQSGSDKFQRGRMRWSTLCSTRGKEHTQI